MTSPLIGCLGKSEAGTGDCAGTSWLVPASDRGGDGSPSRDGCRLLEVGRDSITGTGGWGCKGPSKAATSVITGSDGSKPANEVITGFLPEATLPGQGGKRSSGASEPYRGMIELELSRGRNAMGIWQDLVDKHGFTSSYQSVQRFVLKLSGAVSPEARVIVETKPGEEAQVDYGTGPMVRDPDSGKYRRTRLFVLTLGSSRKSVRLLVFRSSARVWAELHEKAFRRLGGSPRIVVLDTDIIEFTIGKHSATSDGA